MASEKLVTQVKHALAQHYNSRPQTTCSISEYETWVHDFVQLLADYDFTVGDESKRDQEVKAWVEENVLEGSLVLPRQFKGSPPATEQDPAAIPRADPVAHGEECWEDMNRYMAIPNWDYLVDTIHRVERGTMGEITVYFTSRHGEKIKETGRLCKARLPKKLLAFYEEHLRWDNNVVD
ncbi:hypothetical protein AX15_004706 [Amanita polypyramis BW_CC]|nr:hypothetical protein AX15_004706 [Amanita polypyramis BW_CC]